MLLPDLTPNLMSQQETQFKQSLGLLDATMIVVGSMIGSGIFIVSADITRTVGSPGWLMVVWLLTGLLTVIAAVSYGELSGMFPKAGGQYVYLREAYNPMVGFLYGWSFFAVIQTGTIAAVGVAFGKFAAYLFPSLGDANVLADLGFLKINAAQMVSIVMIAFLTWVNTRGIESGKWIQRLFTLTKIASLFGLIILGLTMGAKGDVWSANWSNAWEFGNLKLEGLVPIGGLAIITTLAVASVGSIFSSDAWNNVTFIAGEIQNPQRNIGLSLFLGTVIVTLIYLLANIMYTAVLPMHEIAFAASDRVGVDAAKAIFGTIGTAIIAIMLMISTFGCNNGLILSGARVYHTMANDGLFFHKAGILNENKVPSWGLWAQGIWAALLCLSGKYGDLLDYVVFVVLIFYILTIAGIFILRRKNPDAPRPYRAFGYPVLPALYIVLAGIICVSLLVYKPMYTFPGLAIVLLGIPVYYWAVRSK